MKSYLKIPIIYAFIGAIWIYFSDKLMSVFYQHYQDYQIVQTWKGWFFVVVTALLLAGLIYLENERQVRLMQEIQYRQELLERSIEELREANQETRQLAHRLAEAEETERKALARELHDRVGQSLTAMNILLNLISSKLPDTTPAEVYGRVKEVQNLVEETMIQIRDVMALLRPPVIDDYGLDSALRWLAEHFEKRTGVACLADCRLSRGSLPSQAEISLYRIAQGALDNIAKHANANKVRICLEENDHHVIMTIEDDGKGFNPAEVGEQNGRAHWGLKIMRERAIAVGGVLDVESSKNYGTKITITIKRNDT